MLLFVGQRPTMAQSVSRVYGKRYFSTQLLLLMISAVKEKNRHSLLPAITEHRAFPLPAKDGNNRRSSSPVITGTNSYVTYEQSWQVIVSEIDTLFTNKSWHVIASEAKQSHSIVSSKIKLPCPKIKCLSWDCFVVVPPPRNDGRIVVPPPCNDGNGVIFFSTTEKGVKRG